MMTGMAFGALGSGMSLLLKFRAPEMQSAIERVRSGAACRAAQALAVKLP